MNEYRSWLGNKLFKLAADLYVPGNLVRMQIGDFMFKLAAQVSPDKKKTVKKTVKKTTKAKKPKK